MYRSFVGAPAEPEATQLPYAAPERPLAGMILRCSTRQNVDVAGTRV